jgi:FHS family L-fucose permease-like MFS transporter
MAITNASKPVTGTSTSPPRTDYQAMAMVTTLFFMWGFLTSLNDVIIPHLKTLFDLDYAEAMLVQVFFFTAYVVFAFPSGKLIDWIGYKRSMVAGLCTMGLGALMFLPAAAVPSFPLFLLALSVLAAGITCLQVSANPYVAVLGPEKTSSSRLNLTQAFNSLGTTIGPYLGGLLILGAAVKSKDELDKMGPTLVHAYRVGQASSVKLPYAVIAAALFLLAVIIGRFRLPDIAEAHASTGESTGPSIWKYRHVVLGAVCIFAYVGGEVAIGSGLVNYLGQRDIANIPPTVAKNYLSLYWGGLMVGRFAGSYLLTKFKPRFVLAGAAIVCCLLVTTSVFTAGPVAVWSIILVGLFESIMFPTIFTLGIARLGPLTDKGSGLLIGAIVGGAVIPGLLGELADHIGLHRSFLLTVLCFLYIAFYGLKGSKPREVLA